MRSPVAIAFDERERLWVVEMPDYPTGAPEGESPRGRIVTLEDRDSDGRYEHAAVFRDELLFATGILPWRGGVFVTGQFGIRYMRDDDGDGRSDREEPLYAGSYTEVSQHFLNSPTLGLDGWVYVANGLRTDKVTPVTKPDEAIDVRGLDFRFDPVGGRHAAAAGMGQFGMSFDSWGRRFTVTNRNHVIHAVAPHRYLSRNPYLRVPVVRDDQSAGGAAPIFPLSANWTTSIRHAGSFTAACGIHVYESDRLPPRYRGSAFTADPTGNLVHQALLTPRGASFEVGRAREGVEFLASPDSWFRPVFVTDGPDGALYVVDMYQGDIEHPIYVPEDRRGRMNPEGGRALGRIWRVAPDPDADRTPEPDLAAASDEDLAAALESGNRWRRATAHRLLLERREASAVPALRRLVSDSPRPEARVHAAWLLAALDGLEQNHVVTLLAHAHPRVRENAVRLAEPWLGDSELLELLLERVEDEDARVRFQLALSLGELGGDRVLQPLARIALQAPGDPWTRIAVESAAHGRRPALLATLFPAGSPDREWDPGVEALLRELTAEVGAAHPPAGLTRVVGQALSWSGPGTLRWQLAALSGLADGLLRQGLSRRDSVDRLRESLGRSDIATQLPALAADRERPLGERLDAVSLLGLAPWAESRAALEPLLAAGEAPELAAEAARTIAGYPEPEAGRLLLDGWPSALPEQRRALLAALASRDDGLELLLEALEARRLAAAELTPALIQRLRTDAGLGERARGVLSAAALEPRGEVVARYGTALRDEGDAARGREVFRENCAACHRVDGIGVAAGPDISDTRTKSRKALLGDILDPSRAIDAGYTRYSIVTRSGEQLSGFIAARGGASLTLRDANGRDRVLSLDSVREIRSDGVSAMPEGFEETISVEEMRHLLEFLKNWRFEG